MALEALQHTQSRPADGPVTAPDSLAGWLNWLHPQLAMADWIGVACQDTTPGAAPRLSGHPEHIATPPAAMLVARKVLSSSRVTSVRLNDRQGRDSRLLAIPMSGPAQIPAVLLLRCADMKPAEQHALIRFCQWAGLCLQLTHRRHNGSLAEQVLKAYQHRRSAASMALALVDTLKRVTDSQRVSLGIRQAGSAKVHLLAVSDQLRIDRRRVLPTQLADAMREAACDSAACLLASAPTKEQMQRMPAACTLFHDQGRFSSLACVIATGDQSVEPAHEGAGAPDTRVVLLLQRGMDRPFRVDDQSAVQAEVASVCLLLAVLLQQEAGLMARLRQRFRLWLDGGHWYGLARAHALLLLGGVTAVAMLCLPVAQTVTARAVIESRDMHVVAAPLQGILAASHVRAGDAVTEGQLLATLDDTDLRLAADKWASEMNKNEQARDIALAARDRVEIGRLKADAARIRAEQSLLELQLERTRLRAPIDGVVLSGDLSQHLGSAVSQGEKLYTVGSSERYRLVLDIDERDVSLVQAGQQAQVRMASIPDRSFQARVDSVLPVAATVDEQTVFRVPAQIDQDARELRPGMEGVARLRTGRGPFIAVHTRGVRETVRLWLWHLGLLG